MQVGRVTGVAPLNVPSLRGEDARELCARNVYKLLALSKGYAGIVNAVFYADNCRMVYGDAQAVLISMFEAVRGLGLPAAA